MGNAASTTINEGGQLRIDGDDRNRLDIGHAIILNGNGVAEAKFNYNKNYMVTSDTAFSLLSDSGIRIAGLLQGVTLTAAVTGPGNIIKTGLGSFGLDGACTNQNAGGDGCYGENPVVCDRSGHPNFHVDQGFILNKIVSAIADFA